MVDDQDYMLNSTHRGYMPKLHQYIGDEGIHLNNFIVTTSICCPSRVSLLTGKFTHNHNITSNQSPQGSYSKWEQVRIEERGYLATWLKEAGYSTYFTGKFLNGFDVAVGDTASCPRDWTIFDPLTDRTVFNYINFDFQPQCARLDSFREEYQTDVMTNRSLAYIDDAVRVGKPFYLQINPAACHTACERGEDGGGCTPPPPPARYKNRFPNVKVPRSPNWGVFLPPEMALAPDKDLSGRAIDNHYQARIEAMMAVEDMIEAIVNKLEDLDILDNTYFMYVSDNGYHLGNHALAKGKHLPYEEDVRVPFFMRGPGIGRGIVSPYMATMVDLTATMLQMARGSLPAQIDGIPLPLDRIGGGGEAGPGRYPNFPRTPGGPLRDMLPLELWANALDKRIDKKDYRSVRVCGTFNPVTGRASGNEADTICWKYNHWCIWPETTNWIELFNLRDDVAEVNNLHSRSGNYSNLQYVRLLKRLDAMMQANGYCEGEQCRDVWRILHPDGSVRSFDQAMDARYDAQYNSYITYSWRACTRYYDPVNNEVADPLLGGRSRFAPQRPPGSASGAGRRLQLR